jgi:hypothetical protein
MKQKKSILLVLTFLMIGGTMGVLGPLRAHQKMGAPGVKTEPIPDSKNLHVLLPESVPGFISEEQEISTNVLNWLPKDTSFGSRRYVSMDNMFSSDVNVVLMGIDRGSIHNPKICLTAQAWDIDAAQTRNEIIRVTRPQPYDLKVTKMVSTKVLKTKTGESVTARGLYVFWFVADGVTLADRWGGVIRTWNTGVELVRSGTLRRWAYVSYFSLCPPGQEEATFEKMKTLIAESVPEFQLTPGVAEQQAVSMR